MKDRIFHQVRYDNALDWLACGWIALRPNAAMHHHDYGVMMEWLCDCQMPRPLEARR